MATNQNFYVRKTREHRFFAIELKRAVLATAIPGFGEHYFSQLQQKEVNWLTTLLGSCGNNAVFDLRIVSTPGKDEFLSGSITITLFCRVSAASTDDLPEQVLRLTRTYYDNEYEFEPVQTKEEFEYLLMPFNIRDYVQILHRSDMVSLDLPLGGTSSGPGFRPTNKQTSKSDNRIFHVYPFVATHGTSNHLFSLLLRQNSPMAISFRISEASLSGAESRTLISQISKCENYSQLKTEHDEDAGIFSRLEQADVFKKALMRTLRSLNNSAVTVQIEVVSPNSVPESVIQLLGTTLTKPTAHSDNHLDSEVYLSGGFCVSRGIHDNKRTTRAWKELGFSFDLDENVPKGANRLKYLCGNLEAASIFRFPLPTVDEIPGLDCKEYRTQLFGGDLGAGHLIGHSNHNSLSKAVRLSRSDRRRHVYAVGQTGTGKSTMFASMILEDMRNGEGLCVIDPHGDLIDKILKKIPANRTKDVIVFDPGELNRPIGFNILEYEDETQKHFLIQELLAIIDQLVTDTGMKGPAFFQHSKMVLRLVMSNPEVMGTLPQFYQVFAKDSFYKRFLPLQQPDSLLQAFIDFTLSKDSYTRVSSDGSSMGGYIGSKYEPFIGDPMLRNIFGQRRSTIDLRRIMDEGKILLVNLSKGKMGEMNARFFGMVLIAKLQAAIMSRANTPDKERRDFYLYVDEFQNLATQNFGVLLAEARKYRLSLILTNQFVSQVPPLIREAITGNVGTIISFRVGSTDAEYLERDFIPTFNRFDLMNLPNFNTYVSTLIDGQVTKPFSMRIISDFSEPNNELAREIVGYSGKKYGRPREIVEKEIEISLGPPNPWQYNISELDLSTRTRTRLEKGGFVTLADIVRFTKTELTQMFSFSEKSVHELEELLGLHGFSFRNPSLEWWVKPESAISGDLDHLKMPPFVYHFLQRAGVEGLSTIVLLSRIEFIGTYRPEKSVMSEIDKMILASGFAFQDEVLASDLAPKDSFDVGQLRTLILGLMLEERNAEIAVQLDYADKFGQKFNRGFLEEILGLLIKQERDKQLIARIRDLIRKSPYVRDEKIKVYPDE